MVRQPNSREGEPGQANERIQKLRQELTQLLTELEVTDYTVEKKENRIHFLFNLPEEHKRERRAQMAGLGTLELTKFDREKILPLVKRIKADESLSCELRRNQDVLEVIVSEK